MTSWGSIYHFAQLHLTKLDISFGAGSNPAHGVLEIPDGEDLWQPLTGNQTKCLSLVNYTIKAIHHHNRFHHQESQIFKSFKPFSPVCLLLLQLAQTIVFLSDGITEDISSYKNLSLSWAFFNCHVVAFFESTNLKDFHIFFFYLQSNRSMLVLKFQSESLVSFHQALK